jgi:AraC-like DNA-binding protein
MVYSGQKVAEKNSYFVIEFDTDKPLELERLGLERITPAAKGTRERFRKILEVWNNGDVLLCRALIYDLLHTLTYASPEEEPLKKAIALMKHRISDPELSVADLCNAVSISESHLRRMFHQEVGRSPMQYLNDLRMAQAKNMLLQGDIAIGEIAEFCGYSTLYYFSRDFKAKTGLSPTLYRQEHSI